MIQIRKRSDGTFHMQVPTADFGYFQSATGIPPEENRSYGWSFDVKAVGDPSLVGNDIEANASLPSLAGTGRMYSPAIVGRLDGKNWFYVAPTNSAHGLLAVEIINPHNESSLHGSYTLTTDDDKIQKVKELIDEARDLLCVLEGDSYGC